MDLMKYVPDSVSRTVGRGLLKTQNVSPTVLFVGGVVGVVATAVLASRATLKLELVLDELDADKERGLTLRETLPDKYSESDHKRDLTIFYSRASVNVAKLYAPAIIVGGLSIAALTGSHVILTRRNAALTAAYAALDKGFREYRKRVVDELGEDADRRFRYSNELVEPDKDGKPVRRVVDDYSIYARFFDELNDHYQREPEYNFLFLKCQQNWANDMLRARGHLFLNEVYDRLGIDRSKPGQVVGWVRDSDGDNYVDFGIFNGDQPRARDFVNGREHSILLDFNVDGVIYDLL